MSNHLGVATTNRRHFKMDEFEWEPDEHSLDYEYYGRLGTSLELRAVAHLEHNRGAGYRGWTVVVLGSALRGLPGPVFTVVITGGSRGLDVAKRDVATVTAKVLAAFN